MSEEAAASLELVLEEMASLREEVQQLRDSLSSLHRPVFRTPEEVAPELGIRPTELRRYVRESGICTRLSKNRIMLHEDDITKIIEWVRGRKDAAEDWSAEVEHDPFA